ncbi:hypothetical protein NW757_011050 [Fusarium falciforme]|nr:hypothetical protein NW757_011050 [Fusarium falciforme]
MERFFRKLQVGKSVKRMNWVVQTHGDLINTSGNHIKDGDDFVADEEVDCSKASYLAFLDKTITDIIIF